MSIVFSYIYVNSGLQLMDRTSKYFKKIYNLYGNINFCSCLPVWAFVKSFKNRPPGDYHTEVCDIRLKDKKYDEALRCSKY